MSDDGWNDNDETAPATNSIGFGMPGQGQSAGRGFKAGGGDNGFDDRRPGGGRFGGGNKGFDRDNQDGDSRGNGGFRGDRGGGSFNRRNNDDEGGDGGGRKFGGGRGGGNFGRRNDDGEGGGSRSFGGGRGGFNRRNDDGEDGGGGGGGFGGGRGGDNFGRQNDDGEGGGSRSFGGGRGGFNRRNDDGEDGGGGGGGFGGGFGGGRGGGGGGFNRRNDDGEGGGRGGGGRFNRRNDDGEDGGGGGGFGGGRGGGGGGFNRRNDDGEGGGRGGNFGRRRDNGEDGDEGRGRGGGRGRDGGEGDDGKPREIYIPKERTVEELYEDTTKAGINFAQYDKIDVNVSGDNKVPQIPCFEEANLRDLLMDNIKKCGYTKPTPIQKYALPIVMGGRDLMACAQTGSGKTAAFVIPIIQRLMEKPREIEDLRAQNCVEPRAIVVAPTRELAIQTFNVATKLCKGSVLHARVCYGGTSVGNELRQLFNGCDILVATVGRMMGLVGMGKLSFAAVEFVVLDEADRMLDPKSISDIERILRHDTMTPPGKRQTLMFSATFPSAIQELASEYLNNYLFVAVGIVGGACTDIEQNFLEVTKREKRQELEKILQAEKDNDTFKGILVFVETKKQADFLGGFLSELKYPSTTIHGDRLQREREQALYDFTKGRMGLLVATAVGARGLDIPCVRHVINYDMPQTIDEYIHRIGRTGRVGNQGKATSFYDPDVDNRIKDDLIKILGQANQPIPDWLENGSRGNNYGPASSFGGQDIRSFSDVQDESRGAAQPVEPEESW